MTENEQSNSTMTNIPSPLNLQSDVDDNHKTDQILTNDLLLHEAVYKNEIETVEKILKEEVNVNSRNNYGRAPIHWAASRGYTEIMEMLIESKCDIEISDKFGMRPVHMAASYGHQKAVKLLIDAGANVSAVNKKKHTLLMCAARGNSAAVIEYLVNAVENLDVNAIDNTGASAFHHAAASGCPDGIIALSKIPNIKLDAIDQKGQNSLHCACEHGHIDAVEVLIKLYEQLNHQNIDGNTALHLSTLSRHTEIAQALLKAGANVEVVDKVGLTALHVAASQGCNGILQSILEYGNQLSINIQCNAGNTPLHLACENNQIDTVEILIKHDANLNCFNSRLQTPIHIAAEMGHTDVCKLLLAAGANIEQREKGGKNTLLYIAARGSFTAIVDMIIKTARLEYPKDRNAVENNDVRRKWIDESQGIKINEENNDSIAEHVQHILQRLARDELGPGDWKKLAIHWDFTQEQIQAIEHQHTGSSSYQDHGYRMLVIWTSGLSENTQFFKELHDALVAIDKKNIAESIRKLLEQDFHDKNVKHRCNKCCIT
ncbi:hypothetical protein HCN44_010548 [Aphidius gifuensis]|uniref:Death domain-containing protein n=2 Tax=Aphidius gifuensis TaxID=684658 RepID=A0A834XUA1_APHGI|nr:hypothetical protein HCN44_010548 [Aphidius gifuensis]